MKMDTHFLPLKSFTFPKGLILYLPAGTGATHKQLNTVLGDV